MTRLHSRINPEKESQIQGGEGEGTGEERWGAGYTRLGRGDENGIDKRKKLTLRTKVNCNLKC